MPRELAMFPLGSVLLPSMMLPLHVFEPRYRVMVDDLLAGDATFGVTLIERGSEVGGSDVRAPVGCTAQILDAEQQPDGRWHLLAVGVERVMVNEWLEDAPYPRAMVDLAPDRGPRPDLTGDTRWIELDSAFREILTALEPLGSAVSPSIELAEDPATATFEMAALVPIGAFDRYRILGCETAAGRRELLLDAFEGLTVMLSADDPGSAN